MFGVGFDDDADDNGDEDDANDVGANDEDGVALAEADDCALERRLVEVLGVPVPGPVCPPVRMDPVAGTSLETPTETPSGSPMAGRRPAMM